VELPDVLWRTIKGPTMNKDEILTNLQQYKERNSGGYLIRRIGIFGSVARGSSTIQSDVDIVVELERQDLFDLIGIKQDLEERLSCPVDIVSYRKKMNPFLKRRIDNEAIYV
jgi:predicted nucleotidyltransferase